QSANSPGPLSRTGRVTQRGDVRLRHVQLKQLEKLLDQCFEHLDALPLISTHNGLETLGKIGWSNRQRRDEATHSLHLKRRVEAAVEARQDAQHIESVCGERLLDP